MVLPNGTVGKVFCELHKTGKCIVKEGSAVNELVSVDAIDKRPSSIEWRKLIIDEYVANDKLLKDYTCRSLSSAHWLVSGNRGASILKWTSAGKPLVKVLKELLN